MSKGYPKVMSEMLTLEAVVGGRSISRYGDGELKVALGRKCVSQVADPRLAEELRAILINGGKCLVGIPNVFSRTPKQVSWMNFTTPAYTRMYGQKGYASSFITRPDSAPWIDTPEYWDKVRELWRGRDVTLVVGDERSLREGEIRPEAASLRIVRGSTKSAYAEIDRIEEEVGRPSGPVIMCLGCTATALAKRLCDRGVWAIDLGHLGMFMRHAGIYGISIDELASIKYRHELMALHASQDWGTRGARHAPEVKGIIDELHARNGLDTDKNKITVLDYGCGRGSMREALAPHRVMEYDPGIPGKDVLPKPCDVVVCTDVMEHVEPKSLIKVIDHINRLTARMAYVVIATRQANAVLPSGRNAHLIVENAAWWEAAFVRPGWSIRSAENRSDKELRLTIVRERR